jgi:cell division protein FtsN
MTNPDRGAYTPPTDQPLAFDARQPVRGRGPAPMMLFASALVLLVLVAAIAVFYRSGVDHGPATPPVVGKPVGAIKGAAPAEAQPSEPAEGLQIYQQAEGQAAPAAPNFTPPPEQPQMRAAAPVVTTPAPKAAPVSAPVAALPMAPALKPTVNATAPEVKAPAPIAAKPAPAPVAAKPAPVAAKPAAAPPVAAKPPVAKTPAPQPVAAKPAAAKAVESKPTATSGAASVQIGAFSSQALADKGWNDAAKIAPGAAAGKGKKVEAVAKGGSTLYRTTVTGFSSRAAADAFCNQLKAAGKSCFVK